MYNDQNFSLAFILFLCNEIISIYFGRKSATYVISWIKISQNKEMEKGHNHNYKLTTKVQ